MVPIILDLMISMHYSEIQEKLLKYEIGKPIINTHLC